MITVVRAYLIFLMLCVMAEAKITLPEFFSDGMVLQQESAASIWGRGEESAAVRVEFCGKVVNSMSDESGHWKVTLKGLKSSAKGQDLKVSVGSEQKVISDVVVGEVWIASGQSNMEWPMAKTDSAEYAQTVHRPLVRQYVCGNVASDVPQWDLPGRWVTAIDRAPSRFSAVGFHFAEELSLALGVPIGIIEIAWGGKPVEAFMREEVINNLPEAKPLREERQRLMMKYAQSNGKERPDHKKKRKNPASNPQNYGSIFNGMVAPIKGYGARGVVWYQGESNTNDWRAEVYAKHLQVMVADWRALWEMELSFYQVQLANYAKSQNKRTNENRWVEVQDQQRRSYEMIPKSGLVVSNDIGNPRDVHPGNKRDIGLRLARWAKFYDYGKKDVLYSGPLYQGVEFSDTSATVTFKYEEGLKSNNGKPLKWFELAGEDGLWAPAQAVIKGNTVEVRSEAVKNPKMVRYAWHENPEGANLTNSSGLPASCFTSQD